MKCSSCFYYERLSNTTAICRRYPPTPVVDLGSDNNAEGGGVSSVYTIPADNLWPEVGLDDWCGEYQEKK